VPAPMLVEAARQAIAAGEPEAARERAEAIAASLLQPVINATGVLLHTNLGRAPLGVHQEARYSSLEIDLTTGKRGSRGTHFARMFSLACGAESAVVVNNGASAVLLALSALAGAAARREVVVSRGELVEIGGGFRIPEVLAASGAKLVEVGTTNRTRLSDYEKVIGPDVALVLKVHQSNYRLVGFSESVPVSELAGLGMPVVFDIGSGLLDANAPWLSSGPPAWLADEPAARQALAEGASIVTFSTDKLFGGPQAGVIAGRGDLVAACGRHPLYRALRPGRLVLSALQETLLAYLRRDGASIPFWSMAATPVSELSRRARELAVGEVVECESVAGGGSLPGLGIPSAGVALAGDLTAGLRRRKVPIVARVHEGRTLADLRTVDPADDAELAAGLCDVIGETLPGTGHIR
ncbi:MAG: L-seryl-tRNA(Sec) selenium transferase, partial [Acidimicrobiales bacterium]